MNSRTFLAQSQARRQLKSNCSLEEFDDLVEEMLHDWQMDEAQGIATPYTDYIESGRDNCDDWGTGEGAFHGRFSANYRTR